MKYDDQSGIPSTLTVPEVMSDGRQFCCGAKTPDHTERCIHFKSMERAKLTAPGAIHRPEKGETLDDATARVMKMLEDHRPDHSRHPANQHAPEDAKARKALPLATGCIDYFPDALLAIAELSKIGNDKHNPGEPLHWSRGKSNDHPDCLMRHFVDRGKIDHTYPGDVKIRHSTQVAWRALAILQLEIEESRK